VGWRGKVSDGEWIGYATIGHCADGNLKTTRGPLPRRVRTKDRVVPLGVPDSFFTPTRAARGISSSLSSSSIMGAIGAACRSMWGNLV
jgi:hypothetical protein